MTTLRRGQGLYWCPAGAHYVGAAEIHVLVDARTQERIKLDACKACQTNRGRANQRAAADARLKNQ